MKKSEIINNSMKMNLYKIIQSLNGQILNIKI